MVRGQGFRGAGRASGGGFTYVEALMTAAVILIMVGISIPMVTPRYRTYQLRGAAWQVAGDLRLARQRAVTTRNSYRFVFTDSAAYANPNTYVIQYCIQQGGVCTWVQEIPALQGTRKGLNPAIGIDPDSTPSTRTMTFNSNGSVVPTGTIQLAGTGGIAVSVTVAQAGRVQIN